MKDKPYELTLKFKETGAKIIIENDSLCIIGDINKYKSEIVSCVMELLSIAGPCSKKTYRVSFGEGNVVIGESALSPWSEEEIERDRIERHKDKIKPLVDINPYFDRFEIHGTEVFWKRKVIFFKNGKKVKTITGWKDHMYCTDCLFEKNKIVDLLTMPDETMNCPFCNGPMLEVS